MTLLCLAGYEKGHDFMRAAKARGCTVVLVSTLRLKDKAQWPMESIDELFYMPDVDYEWNVKDTINGISYLARTRNFDRVIALDDFDVELAGHIREHMRIPGMGDTQVRFFRDKLAMRMKARNSGLPVPDFTPIFNHSRVAQFMDRVPGPWVLKPRSLAGAIGIKKIQHAHELWPQLEALGDMQSFYLLEKFVPGSVFHVDTLMHNGKITFAIASAYGRPPMEVSHTGGVFTTETLDRKSADNHQLLALNERLLTAFGLENGASHTEFIKAHEDGSFYFLETSCRVGGAHIADLVEAASGINLWAEWAKIECGNYEPPTPRQDYAGLLVSLARDEYPDTSSFNDPEISWRMNKKNHIGFIVHSSSRERVQELIRQYANRIQSEFTAVLPPREKPDA